MCTVSYQPGSHTVRNTKLRQHTDTKRLNTVKSQLIRTSSKVAFNSIFTAEIFTTWTTAKRFVARQAFSHSVVELRDLVIYIFDLLNFKTHHWIWNTSYVGFSAGRDIYQVWNNSRDIIRILASVTKQINTYSRTPGAGCRTYHHY